MKENNNSIKGSSSIITAVISLAAAIFGNVVTYYYVFVGDFFLNIPFNTGRIIIAAAFVLSFVSLFIDKKGTKIAIPALIISFVGFLGALLLMHYLTLTGKIYV